MPISGGSTHPIPGTSVTTVDQAATSGATVTAPATSRASAE